MGFKEQYFDIWQQVWSLHKKYYVIQEQDEKRWKQLNDECEAIDNQYSGRPEQRFVQSLLLGVELVEVGEDIGIRAKDDVSSSLAARYAKAYSERMSTVNPEFE